MRSRKPKLSASTDPVVVGLGRILLWLGLLGLAALLGGLVMLL